MAETDVKTYEISYTINGDIAEDEVFGEAGKITGAIQDAHGLVGRIDEPRKRRLSYPIAKHSHGYFGCTIFTVAPERLSDIEKKIALEKNILRHLITDEVKRPVVEFRPRREARLPVPSLEPITPFTPQAPKEEDKAKIEELDKQLEEILGK